MHLRPNKFTTVGISPAPQVSAAAFQLLMVNSVLVYRVKPFLTTP
jgi:hypothetical protein